MDTAIFHRFTYLLIIMLFHSNLSSSQDSLSIEVLRPISLTFNINDGKLSGDGATYLKERLSKAQFTMLGEFHGSKNISEFTEALVPILDQSNYNHMILEVGPNTGQFLDKLPKDKKSVESNLKQLNQKYLRTNEDDVQYPIPFFDKQEDAHFLGEAKEREWKIIGIDQEYADGMMMNIDWMYDNLKPATQKDYRQKYQGVKDTLKRMYAENDSKSIPIYTAMLNSKFIQGYLSVMSEEEKNGSLVEAMKKSMAIYHMNTIGKWYENNDTRIKYMKERLRLSLNECNFDVSKDKLLAKMGGYHMSQGFSPLGFYEVGNMLNELAEYHGNEAVNIGFINRYEMTEDGLEDALDSGNKYYDNLKSFYGLGAIEDWIVIDLITMRKGYYYHPQKYKLNNYEEKMIQRYDVLIITPTEYEGRNNY